jgi:protein-S-isoprenylcysteine O-methyltransferase Ste14
MTSGSSRLPSLGPRGEGWVALQFALLAGIVFLGFEGSDWHGWTRWLGVPLALGGAAGAVVSLRGLGPALTPLPFPGERAVLVDRGIYGVVRHPAYLFVVVAALGWSLVAGSVPSLALTAALALVLDLKSRREEAWLEERFPEYVSYRRRVRLRGI